ncbi:MAG: 2'-deoxycytidine 5'-triphosphate deaminase [bacterium]|nr:2'-deoxycytidine 5'-triphosphate deaminase [bacterium]
MKKSGALPIQELLKMKEAGMLQNFPDDSFQPSSVDLSITDEIYRIKGNILLKNTETVVDIIKNVTLFRHDLNNPLEPGGVYLCKVAEQIRLPKGIYGYTNPKSSTGRNDIHARILADKVPRYDSIPENFFGELWMLISSRHFLLKLTSKDRLVQLRLFDADTRLDETEMRVEYATHKLLYAADGTPFMYDQLKISDRDGSIILTIDLGTQEIIGYRARLKGQSPVLIFNQQGHAAEDFFIPIEKPKNGHIVLENGRFYIFSTLEWSRVPVMFAAEMAAMDERSGEFRSHYAGFIDPGWGYGRNGEMRGLPLVLEIRSFDENLIIRHGQPICKLKYERLRLMPNSVYGETGSNYMKQVGVLLSKHFQSE